MPDNSCWSEDAPQSLARQISENLGCVGSWAAGDGDLRATWDSSRLLPISGGSGLIISHSHEGQKEGVHKEEKAH